MCGLRRTERGSWKIQKSAWWLEMTQKIKCIGGSPYRAWHLMSWRRSSGAWKASWNAMTKHSYKCISGSLANKRRSLSGPCTCTIRSSKLLLPQLPHRPLSSRDRRQPLSLNPSNSKWDWVTPLVLSKFNQEGSHRRVTKVRGQLVPTPSWITLVSQLLLHKILSLASSSLSSLPLFLSR